MDELKTLLESLGYVAKGQETGDFVTKADFEAAITKLTDSITAAVAAVPEMVQKALPQTREGQGRRGTMSDATDDVTLESDPWAYLVKKAQTPEGLTDYMEQAVFTALFKQELEKGLVVGKE